MERSQAIKCPTVRSQLSGFKKVQQELARPGAVKRFIQDHAAVQRIRDTFAGLYSLDLVGPSLLRNVYQCAGTCARARVYVCMCVYVCVCACVCARAHVCANVSLYPLRKHLSRSQHQHSFDQHSCHFHPMQPIKYRIYMNQTIRIQKSRSVYPRLQTWVREARVSPLKTCRLLTQSAIP